MINIRGVDKAALFKALFDNAAPLGLGYLHFKPEPITIEAAKEIVDDPRYNLYFDYVQGRVMKVDLSKDDLWEGLYDRDNGSGACYRAIRHLLNEAPQPRA